ncbi:MAG: hypothetical protein JWP87_1301 [Labilithrix sp.]|nr:hypothetical protein [Labilithrix sp.]
MTDPISTSKSARESLARGLNALQADPSVPPQLVELAAPIAQAMGALHQIERTQQLAPHADVALNHVRGALAQLQAQNANHPAVNQALEAVATSLSLVHSLSRMASGPAAAAARPQAPPQQAPQQPPQQAYQQPPQPRTQAMPQKEPPVQHQPPPQQQAYAQPPQAQPQRISNPQPSFPQGAPAGGGMVARDPFAAPPAPPAQHGRPGGHGAPLAAGMHAQPGMGPSASPSMPVPAPPAGNLQMVNADLGAHSPTNFYKGLAGNDIIDHGGLFVSTYVLPKMGHQVRLKVSLPGGYEFEANAVVKWTREDGGADAPPGFGAQFTQITPEARQLVYRYVRNREPIFHDDF